MFLLFFRCRKKTKRVERRGTLEYQQQQVANQSVQQEQQEHQPQSNSHSNLPLSRGSDHSVHRSDTILTHQQSHSPSSFPQSHQPLIAIPHHHIPNLIYIPRYPTLIRPLPPPPFLIPQSMAHHTNVHSCHKAHLLQSLP